MQNFLNISLKMCAILVKYNSVNKKLEKSTILFYAFNSWGVRQFFDDKNFIFKYQTKVFKQKPLIKGFLKALF